MLQAKELRVGNIIDVFGECEVVAINADKNRVKVKRQSKSGNYLIEWAPLSSLEVNPIPLTEEWLLKFGFDSENDLKHPDAPIYFCLVREELICFLHNCSHRHIKYAHQLQNLFFILTAHELIKNNEPKENTTKPNPEQ